MEYHVGNQSGAEIQSRSQLDHSQGHCIPTTRDRLTEKAKRAAIPPSSATSGLDDLLTSLPTMPPARIFLMKDGMTMRTSTSERKRPTKTPRPSVSCTDGRATNSCPLAGLIADSSRREAPFSEPISKLPDNSQTRFQNVSTPCLVPRPRIHSRKDIRDPVPCPAE